jgi:hypothetical protein
MKIMLDTPELFSLKQATLDYMNFWDDASLSRKQAETRFNSYARRLWKLLPEEQISLNDLSKEYNLPLKRLYRICRRWSQLKIAEVVNIREFKHGADNYHVKKLIPMLPDITYSLDSKVYKESPDSWFSIRTICNKSREKRLNKHGISKSERIKKIRGAK